MSALPELPEPYTQLSNYPFDGTQQAIFIDEQMREYGDARAAHARKQALEKAAKVCLLTVSASDNTARRIQARICADSIKELLK